MIHGIGVDVALAPRFEEMEESLLEKMFTEKEIITILRAVHKYKDSREQFEYRTHKRLIDVIKPSQKAIEALTSLELPAGVEIEIKL